MERNIPLSRDASALAASVSISSGLGDEDLVIPSNTPGLIVTSGVEKSRLLLGGPRSRRPGIQGPPE